jgi:LPS-assembly protein
VIRLPSEPAHVQCRVRSEKMPIPLSNDVIHNQAVRYCFGIALGVLVTVFAAIVGPVFGADRALNEGEPAPWHITANRISALGDAKSLVAEGDVVVSRGKQRLKADKILYDKGSQVISAQGNVELSTPGDILWCDQGTFNLKDKTGTIVNGSVFLSTNHYYLRGEEIRKTGPATYIIRGCRITTCDGENPDWSIIGSEVKVTLEGYGTVKHAVFYVKRIPLLYFPYIIFPAKTKRQTGLLPPSIGYSRRDGVDMEAPFFWAISRQTDATFYERYIEERGLKQGLEFRYITGAESKGAFLFDILSDRREHKDLFNEDDVKISPFPRTNTTRFWARGRTDQSFPYKIGLKLDVDFVSDYDYLREFSEPSLGPEYRVRLGEEFGRSLDEAESPTRRSAILITRRFRDTTLQAASSFNQNPMRPDEDTTAQPVAGLGATILPTGILKLPLFFSLGSDYGYIYRDSGEKGQRLALAPALSYPIWSIPYVAIEPSLKYFITYHWVDEYLERKDKQSRDTYEVGLQLHSIIEKLFDIDYRNIKRLKHKFQPTLSYTFRPYQEQEANRPWFEPIDTLTRRNVIALSLDNFLDARKEDETGQPTYSQCAQVSLTQGYDLDEARKEIVPGEKRKSFTPLEANLSFTPLPAVYLSAGGAWDHYDRHLSSGNVSLDLSIERGDQRQDRYSIDFEYARDSAKSLNYDVAINLLYGVSVGARGKKNLEVDYDIENSYWIDYQSQCWGVRLVYEDLEEDRRTLLMFRLLGMGEVGSF